MRDCLLFFGPPGSGKGTQSEILVKKYSFGHISTGHIFRDHLDQETPLGLEAKKYIDRGDLVPDKVTVNMLKDAILALPEGHFILDGFPRTLNQARELVNLAEEMGFRVRKVLFLEVPDQVLFERLVGRKMCRKCTQVYHDVHRPSQSQGVCDACGGEIYQRKDDSEAVISYRLQAYEKNTAPIKAYYDKSLVSSVDGQGRPEEVEARIKGLIVDFIK